MSKRVLLVVVVVLLAFGVPLVRSPTRRTVTTGDLGETPSTEAGPLQWQWTWDRTQDLRISGGGYVRIEKDLVQWRWVFAIQALILLLGGGLLTWVARRERRRRVEAA